MLLVPSLVDGHPESFTLIWVFQEVEVKMGLNVQIVGEKVRREEGKPGRAVRLQHKPDS